MSSSNVGHSDQSVNGVSEEKVSPDFDNVFDAIFDGDRHRDAGNWALATRSYKMALDIDPSRKDIWVQYGHALKESGRVQDAENAYSRAVALDAGYADAKVHLAHILKNGGAILESIRVFKDLRDSHDHDVENEIDYLQGFIKLDDETKKIIDASIISYINLPSGDEDQNFADLGDSFRDQREWTGAAAAYAAALLIDSALGHIWVQYGHALRESGSLDKAEIAYRKAVLINGRDIDAQLHLAHAYKLNDKIDDALKSFRLLKEIVDVDGEIENLIDRKNTIDTESIEVKGPVGPSAATEAKLNEHQSISVADKYRDSGSWSEAAAAYGAVLGRDPSLRHIWVQYGHALKEGGDLAAAETAYRRAVALDQSDPDPLLHLAYLLKRMRRFDDALRVFQQLVALPGQRNIEDDIVALKIEAEEEIYSQAENRYTLPDKETRERIYAPDSAISIKEEFSIHFKALKIGTVEAERTKSSSGISRLLFDPVALFCLMHNLSPDGEIRITGPNGAVRPPLAEDLRPTARDLFGVGRIVAGYDYKVEEAAFTTTVDLRVRLGGTAAPGRSCGLRFYQLASDGAPTVIARTKISEDGPFFIDIPMLSLMPVLIIFDNGADLIVDTAILPFPTLLRGGAHFGETLAARLAAPGMASPTSLPLALLSEFLGMSGTEAPFAVGRVLVDSLEACGGEAIFSAQAKTWIATLFGLSIAAQQDEQHLASAGGRALAAALAVDVMPDMAERMEHRATRGILDLIIPGDSLPTISAMVTRRFALPDGQDSMIGSFVQADVANNRPRLLINVPPIDDGIIALQPADRVVPLPIMARRNASSGDCQEGCGAAPTNWWAPLVIRYKNPTPPLDAALLMPRAADAAGPVLRRSLPEAWRTSDLLSVIICDTAEKTPAALVEFLSNQTIAQGMDIVRVERTAGGRALSERIAEKFPARHKIIDAHGTSLAEAINLGVAAASSRLIAIVSPNTILHDPRALEVLCVMAASERVATAGCVQLHEMQFKRGQQFTPLTCGYFPTHISLMAPPGLIFEEARTDGAFWQATYPVAANAFRLVVMRREVFVDLQALNAADFPEARFDLDFSLRALAGGYLNLCTSAVTAISSEAVDSGEIVDVLSPAALPIDSWQKVLTGLSVVREL